MTDISPVPVMASIEYAFDFPDFQPFSARAGIGYQDLLETIRYYLERKLTPYVATLPTGLQQQLDGAIATITQAVDAALQSEDTRFAQTLAEIIAGSNTDLNNGTIVAALQAAGSTALAYISGGTTMLERFANAVTKDSNGNVTNWTPAFDAAFAAGFHNIELNGTYYTCTTPIRIPSNSAPRIVSRSGMKGTVLNFFLPAGNDSRAAIEYVGTDAGGEYNYSGITLEGVQIKGNDSVAHGVWLQDVSYPSFKDVTIEGFKGAGLLLESVEDGSFDINVQDCGRSSGDYNSLVDRGNNALTLFSAVHFKDGTTGPSNMLRFTGQIENNKTSPYVRMADGGAIGIWFDKVHAEIRPTPDQHQLDFLTSVGADMEFTGMAMSAFRYGFVLAGFGGVKFSGGRGIGSIYHVDGGNATGQLWIEDCEIDGNVQWSVLGGQHHIMHSKLGALDIDYPGGGPTMISDSIIGAVHIHDAGAGDTRVIFDNCTMDAFSAEESATNVIVRNSKILNNATIASPGGVWDNNEVLGTETINQSNVSHNPHRHWSSGTAVPPFGNWVLGDVCWNSNPTTGSPIGWVVTPAGWKPFGTIGS